MKRRGFDPFAEDFPQPLSTGSVLISDVAPDLKHERRLPSRRFLFGFGLPGHIGGRDTGRYDRHRASVPRRQP